MFHSICFLALFEASISTCSTFVCGVDNGNIVFQEEKDTLLDTYRIVKGDVRALTPDLRKLFLNISETAFGFTGITKQVAEVQRMLPDAMIERPAIEDIMLGNIEGGNK